MSSTAERETAIPTDIFKMYDIRGLAHEELTADLMHQVGLAFGSAARSKSRADVCVGRDARQSSPEFAEAVIEGLLATGCKVVDLGAVPTPLVYFATHQLNVSNAMVITASHNPRAYNGVKMVLDGRSLYGADIQQLRDRIIAKDFARGKGELTESSVEDDYLRAIVRDVRLERPLRVALDCANGIGGAIAPRLLRSIGCEVTELYCEVDGDFPNHEADPTRAENLQDLIEAVRANEADVGLAIDGDADRLVAVSGEGEIIWPDRLMILFAKSILAHERNRTVVFDVKCTRALRTAIEGAGGEAVMWKTGHSLMKSKMAECDGVFGGEMSGHFFFADRWAGFDDGMYASARLCELLAGDSRGAAEVFAELPDSVSTPEIRMAFARPHDLVDEFKAQAGFRGAVMNHLDGVRADFESGFGLMRASNTAPEVVFRFEADTEGELRTIQRSFRKRLRRLHPELAMPF